MHKRFLFASFLFLLTPSFTIAIKADATKTAIDIATDATGVAPHTATLERDFKLSNHSNLSNLPSNEPSGFSKSSKSSTFSKPPKPSELSKLIIAQIRDGL